jgi:hypothetical protein
MSAHLGDGADAHGLLVELGKNVVKGNAEGVLEQLLGVLERMRLAVGVQPAKELAQALGEQVAAGSCPLR